ncbi:MAG: HNH endonuclease [Bacteroidaceae bacterium]|nr:HNH endonuclease [Bacteroidaceae bacterium]
MATELWTRDEMILVLNLYLKLPFGKMDRRNPDVIHLANIIGRTANAVALRLVNYASYDPQLKQRGIAGMAHGGKKCGEYWNEFINDRERLLFESERILAEREGTTIEKKYEQEIRNIPEDIVGDTKVREVKTRVNQNVFRQIVLANYDRRCALTGIDITELLVASHIIPWAENKQERLNPENGICLSSLYDKAFDKGLISFTGDHHVIFSARLKANVGKEYYAKYFHPIEGAMLVTPRKYHINPAFLEWHRDCIFDKQ